MKLETMKKYTIIQNVINTLNNEFTFEELFNLCFTIGCKYELAIDYNDVLYVLISLYDNSKINKIVTQDNKTIFVKNSIDKNYSNISISR